MRVAEIMNKVMVVEENCSLKDAAKIMSDRGIGSLVILKNDNITGIITERDIMKNVDKMNKKISAVMSRNVITTEQTETLDNAALIMSEHKIKRLPVLHKGKLVGIITATDILANSDALNEAFLFD